MLAALAFMQEAVLSSHRSWDPEGGVPRDPFAWGEHAAKPSVFEVTLLLDGVRYPLTDYKPRKEENLERGYLQGRYGATPFLGELVPPPGADPLRGPAGWL